MTFFVLLHLDDAGLDHFVVKIVAFARAFTDAGEHRNTAVQFGDVVDEFHDDDGLADAGAAERADFAALEKRADQINDLDAGRQNLRAGGLIHERRARRDESGRYLSAFTGPCSSTGSPVTLNTRPMTASPTGMEIGRAGIGDFVAALESLGGAHGDGAHPVVAEMLLHFERQLDWAGPAR